MTNPPPRAPRPAQQQRRWKIKHLDSFSQSLIASSMILVAHAELRQNNLIPVHTEIKTELPALLAFDTDTDKLIGILCYYQGSTTTPAWRQLSYVDTSHRKMGVYSQLTHALYQLVASNNWNGMSCGTHPRNIALSDAAQKTGAMIATVQLHWPRRSATSQTQCIESVKDLK